MRGAAERVWHLVWAVVLVVAARGGRRLRGSGRLWWGPVPIINVKYFSDVMREAGRASTTVVTHDYAMFPGAFDRYYADVVADSPLPGVLARRADHYLAFLEILRGYDVVHIPFSGGPLGRTPLAALEPHLLRWAGVRTVMLPYGADFARYSWLMDTAHRHAMLISYPEAGRREDRIERQVKRWMRHADIVVGGLMVEGASRWDVMTANFVTVPERIVHDRERWSQSDGTGPDPVVLLHAPNHRGVKGTEFMLAAVERLRARGLNLELVLLEGRPNDEVLAEMRRADICLDQCIGSAYGLYAIESMAGGATVMANLEDDQRLAVHRAFGWLGQCPIVSADIEQFESTLEHLVRNPALREQLGRLGIEYVRRFHAPQTARHLFASIYRRLDGEDVDLMRLFHPLSSEYMQRWEPLEPPLRRNRPLGLE